MESYLLEGIIISLIFSAYFSGMEIAFVSADRLHIELQKEKGGISGRVLANLIANPSSFIGTTLVGNTVALVLYGKLMTNLLDPILRNYTDNPILVLICQTIISTIAVLATAEFLPKSTFLINPNRMLSFFAVPTQLFVWILYIPVQIVIYLSRVIITKVMKGEYSTEKPAYGITDLSNYLKEIVNKRSIDKEKTEVDTDILSNAIEFKELKVRDCMIPRTELIAIDVDTDIKDLKRAFIASGHSKVLIYKETIDDILGYCHSTKLFRKPKEIREIMSEITIVPETMLANELLIKFTQEHKQIALVVDEFGGTSGIVTIEDAIEEIFGEIHDEYDAGDLLEQKIDDFNYIFSARQEIDHLNEKFDINLPSGDYDTLGGFILSIHGNIPKINNTIDLGIGKVTIMTMQGIKIDKVRLTLTDNNEQVEP